MINPYKAGFFIVSKKATEDPKPIYIKIPLIYMVFITHIRRCLYHLYIEVSPIHVDEVIEQFL